MDLDALKIDRSGARGRAARGRPLRWGGPVFVALVLGLAWVFRSPLTAMVDRLRLPEVGVQRVSRTSAAAAAAVTGTAANGYVVARTRAALSADTPGRIVSIEVTEGSVVKRGDVVARLFSDEYAALLRAAEAELASGESAVRRAEADREVAAAEVERARSDVAAARANQEEAEASERLAAINLERARALVEASIEPPQRLDEARAEGDRARAAVAAAVARVESAERAEALSVSRGTAAEAGLAQARSRLPVLAAQRDQAAATLDKTVVRAPFDGVVVLKDAEVGEVVSPNSQGAQSRGSVATMVDFASLEVQVELPETSLEAVELEAPASIFLDAFPGQAYDGRVLRIWPTANRQKGTVEIRIGFDEPDERLRPEMGARVVFRASEGESETREGPAPGSLLIPTGSVVRVEGRAGVFVVERDVARFREARLGEEKSGRVLVEEGLEEGERIVLDPPAALDDGDRIRIRGD